MWVRSLADCDASCGGKAHGLAKLLAAGLHVPDGFVIVPEAFRVVSGLGDVELDDLGHAFAEATRRVIDAVENAGLPADLIDEVTRGTSSLGDSLAVRSSATLEDANAGSAAGVFSTKTGVSLDQLWVAVAGVWIQTLSPLVASYARRRGAKVEIAVIVQRFVEGERVVMYTRPPGDPTRDEVWIQRKGIVERRKRWLFAESFDRIIDAPQGSDVELVVPRGVELDDAWIVQARPIVHPTTQPRVPPPSSILAILDDGRRWTWDIAHNPDPLSPAQAGLVEKIEQAEIAPWAMRVCGGYLYSTPLDPTEERPQPRPRGQPRDTNTPTSTRTPTSTTTPMPTATPISANTPTPASTASPSPSPSDARLNERVVEIEAQLSPILDGADGTLGDAIDRYLAFYEIWANELSPLAGRQAGVRGERPSAVESTLLAAAREEIDEATVIDRVGMLAPAWDVSVPTYGERPQLIRDAIARARTVPQDRRHPYRDSVTRRADVVIADLRERDDVWFARAQWIVRKAILAKADALGIVADDAFWIPLDELASATELDATAVARRASAQRVAAERAAKWAMPVVVGGDELQHHREPLHGDGIGPRVTGRVVRYGSLATAIAASPGDVVVTRAITPALALLVVGCAAIVSETGGLLDHGAAIARELGITCVVGCRDAWTLLSDGMIVVVDGDRGLVTS